LRPSQRERTVPLTAGNPWRAQNKPNGAIGADAFNTRPADAADDLRGDAALCFISWNECLSYPSISPRCQPRPAVSEILQMSSKPPRTAHRRLAHFADGFTVYFFFFFYSSSRAPYRGW
jgi:hypothetical protein